MKEEKKSKELKKSENADIKVHIINSAWKYQTIVS